MFLCLFSTDQDCEETSSQAIVLDLCECDKLPLRRSFLSVSPPQSQFPQLISFITASPPVLRRHSSLGGLPFLFSKSSLWRPLLGAHNPSCSLPALSPLPLPAWSIFFSRSLFEEMFLDFVFFVFPSPISSTFPGSLFMKVTHSGDVPLLPPSCMLPPFSPLSRECRAYSEDPFSLNSCVCFLNGVSLPSFRSAAFFAITPLLSQNCSLFLLSVLFFETPLFPFPAAPSLRARLSLRSLNLSLLPLPASRRLLSAARLSSP